MACRRKIMPHQYVLLVPASQLGAKKLTCKCTEEKLGLVFLGSGGSARGGFSNHLLQLEENDDRAHMWQARVDTLLPWLKQGFRARVQRGQRGQLSLTPATGLAGSFDFKSFDTSAEFSSLCSGLIPLPASWLVLRCRQSATAI